MKTPLLLVTFLFLFVHQNSFSQFIQTTTSSAQSTQNISHSGNIFINTVAKLTFSATNLSSDVPRLMLCNNGVHAYIDYQDNLYFRANKAWISSLQLFGNGTVGIGFPVTYTSGSYPNLGYKLAVNGEIVCEGLKIQADVPDADFVFEKGYKLLSITELNKFIKNNQHLPNIPSAEDFKSNGYSVGNMDKLLLQKIEELTLYIIKQNERINALENAKNK